MDTIFSDILKVIDAHGWRIYCLNDNGWACPDGVTQFELSQDSPAGEDFSIHVEGRTPDELAEDIRRVNAYFDIDDHVKSVMNMIGAPGLRELVHDAEAIQNMLVELAQAVTYGGAVNVD